MRSCGATNPPGTEFCTNCNSYLAWDRSVLAAARGTIHARPAGAPSTAPTPHGLHARRATVDYSNAGYAQGYPDQGYPDRAMYDQGYPDQGGYADRATTTAATLDRGTAAYADQLPDLRHGSIRRLDASAPAAATRSSPARPDPYAGYGYVWRCERGGSGPGRAQGVPTLTAAALPLAPGDHRSARCGLVVAVAVALRRDPVGIVKGAGTRLRTAVLWVQAGPGAGRSARGHGRQVRPGRPGGRVGRRVDDELGADAGIDLRTRAGTGVIVLNFPPTRIRQMQIVARPGRRATRSATCKPLPKVLGIDFDDGQCKTINLS